MSRYITHPLSLVDYRVRADGTFCTPEELDRIEHAHRENAVFTPDIIRILDDCTADDPEFAAIAYGYAVSVSRDGLNAETPELPDRLADGWLILDAVRRAAMLERRTTFSKTGRPRTQFQPVPAQPGTFTAVNVDVFLSEGMRLASTLSADPVLCDRARAAYDEVVLSYLLSGDQDGTLQTRITPEALRARTGLSPRKARYLADLIRQGIAHAAGIRDRRARGPRAKKGSAPSKKAAPAPTPTAPGQDLLQAAGIAPGTHPSQVTPDQFDKLFAAIAEKKRKKKAEKTGQNSE